MVEQPYDFYSDDDISDVSSSNNYDNTTYNSNNNSNMSDIMNDYFSTHHFSIADSLRPYKFTFACHNVRGLMNPAKQAQILSAFEFKHLDILGVSETKLSLAASLHSFKNTNLFSSWWSHHPSRQTSGGVGLIIRQPLASHVQKIIKWQGRVIYADLYFTSHRFRIINAYVPPASAHNRQERKDTHAYLKSLLSSTLSSNMLMGDLNVCPNKYFTLVSSGLS